MAQKTILERGLFEANEEGEKKYINKCYGVIIYSVLTVL